MVHFYKLKQTADDFVGELTSLGIAGSSGSDILETVDPIRSESQLPHETVNLLFTFTHYNKQSTIVWGSWLSTAIQLIHSAILGNAGSPGSDIMETVDPIRSCLTESVRSNDLKSQLPYGIVNSCFARLKMRTIR
jgi:hypothetical protein